MSTLTGRRRVLFSFLAALLGGAVVVGSILVSRTPREPAA